MKVFSDWKFETSGTGSLGAGFVSASGGMVKLKSPEGVFVDFDYIGAGFGTSLGARFLPEVYKYLPNGSFASTDFTSKGVVIKMPACRAQELSKDDFLGPCIFADAGGGLIAGVGATLLFAGLPTIYSIPVNFNPVLAKALIIMGGYSMVKNYGAGAAVLAGVMYD
jgi:hypothetical protein